ncbi:MAG: tetratricopeptide repeat protein [Selenomonadaceae bacterium]|nr:tetratricopeptide repeat protein [Selenomonadaceae bacterium]
MSGKNYAAVIAELTAQLKTNPNDGELLIKRGNAYTHIDGGLNHAIEDFTRALTLNPYDVVAYARRAHAYILKGEDDKAETDYAEALNLSPLSAAGCFFDSGVTYFDIGKYDKAIANLNRSLESNPSNALAAMIYGYRGLALRKIGQHDKAAEDFTEALRLNKLLAVKFFSDEELKSYRAQCLDD